MLRAEGIAQELSLEGYGEEEGGGGGEQGVVRLVERGEGGGGREWEGGRLKREGWKKGNENAREGWPVLG